jgi:hypothetical protein
MKVRLQLPFLVKMYAGTIISNERILTTIVVRMAIGKYVIWSTTSFRVSDLNMRRKGMNGTANRLSGAGPATRAENLSSLFPTYS